MRKRIEISPLRKSSTSFATAYGKYAYAFTASLFAASQPMVISLAKERAGRPPARFLAVVGDWIIARDDAGKPVIQVDGRQWIKGQPSAGLAAKARTIYGARHEEFIDSVKAYAYFPYSVAKDVPEFSSGEISIQEVPPGQLLGHLRTHKPVLVAYVGQ